MGLQDPASESSAHGRQTLPSLPGGNSTDPNDSDTNPLASNATPQNNTTSPSSQLQISPSPVPDVSNSTITPPHPVASSPSPPPGATNANSSTTPPKPPGLTNESLSPVTSPAPVPIANITTPIQVTSPKNGTNVTIPSVVTSLTPAVTNDSNNNTLTSTVQQSNAHPFVTPHRNLSTPAPAAQADNTSGLSGGAITGIAIVAGIIGFILLFWVGVQLLQSKRRRREEAEMQEINFYPSGGSSVRGMAYPRATGSLDRQPSASNSFNYNKGGSTHYNEAPYVDGTREEGEYIESTNQEFESGLQRQATLGSSSAYSVGYYNNPVPPPPAPYTNYSPYSHHYGMQPAQAVYEQRPYEYPLANAPTGEYHQSHAQSNPPTSIEYQR